MPQAIESILVQQFLHGYADGHTLIQGSARLPAAAARTVLVQSDLYGGTVPSEFDGYLTGYPVPEVDAYAVARTWYAYELPRPGCVWTHTLLIQAKSLDQLEDPEQLLGLFRRPQNSLHEHYSRPLEAPTTSTLPARLLGCDDLADLRQVIEVLYSDDTAPVIVAARKQCEYDRLLLGVWRQQWPAMRLTFSFCTAAVTVRRVNQRPFSLTVVPSQNVRHASRDFRAVRVVDGTSSTSTRWSRIAVRDAASPRSSRFRRFLWSYAAGETARTAFARTAEVYLALRQVRRQPRRIPALLDIVGTAYPMESQGARLKLGLFGRDGLLRHKLGDDSALLRALAIAEDPRGLDPILLQVEERAASVARTNPTWAIEILSGLPTTGAPTSLRVAVYRGAVDALTDDQLIALLNQRGELTEMCVRARPAIAAQPEFWHVRPPAQRQRCEAVIDFIGQDDGRLPSVILAMLEADADTLVPLLRTSLGPRLVSGLLLALDALADRNSKPYLSDSWRRVVSVDSGQALACIRSHSVRHTSTAATVASILDPRSDLCAKAGTRIWLPFVEAPTGHTQVDDRMTVGTFLFTLSLRSSDETAGRAAVRSFHILHSTASHQEISYRLWSLLDDILPTGSWWQSWDRCERLRRGFIHAFDDHGWGISDFAILADDANALGSVIATARDMKSGRRVLDRLQQEMHRGAASLSAHQLAVMHPYF